MRESVRIVWTTEKMKQFEEHICTAEKVKAASFRFEGYAYDVEYARFLLSFLKSELGEEEAS